VTLDGTTVMAIPDAQWNITREVLVAGGLGFALLVILALL
jgi:hypothetical protein